MKPFYVPVDSVEQDAKILNVLLIMIFSSSKIPLNPITAMLADRKNLTQTMTMTVLMVHGPVGATKKRG